MTLKPLFSMMERLYYPNAKVKVFHSLHPSLMIVLEILTGLLAGILFGNCDYF